MSAGARRHGLGLLCLAAVGLGLWFTRGTDAQSRRLRPGNPPAVGEVVPARRPPRAPADGTSEVRPADADLTLRYTYRRLFSLGDPAPGGAEFAGDFELSDLNDAGEFPLVSDDARGEALYFISRSGGAKLAGGGDPTPGGDRYGGIVWTPQAINNRGEIAWAGTVETGATWVFVHDGRTGRGTVVVRPGMPAPGGGIFMAGGRLRPEINDRGDIAFVAPVGEGPVPPGGGYGLGGYGLGGYPGGFSGNMPGGGYAPFTPQEAMLSFPATPGVFLFSAEGLRVVARAGIPIHSRAVFTRATAPAINNAGAVVFHAATSDREGPGVYLWEEGFYTVIAAPGERFQQAYAPQIDDAGRVVFVGRTGRGDALYRWEEGEVRPIVAAGDHVPGVGRLQWLDLTRRQPFRLNAGGAVAFTALVGERPGIFLWKEGEIRCVALAGVTLPGAGRAAEVGSLAAAGPTIPGPGQLSPRPGPGSYGGYGAPPPNAGAYGYAPPPATAGPYAPPGSVPYPDGPGGSFGLGLSDSGQLVFAATIAGKQSVVLAVPRGD